MPVLVSVCAIGLAVPLAWPVIVPPDGVVCIAAVYEYVVPTAGVVELNVTVVVPPLQTVCADAEPTGIGLTVIVNVIGVPVQVTPAFV